LPYDGNPHAPREASGQQGNLSSAIRLFVLDYFRTRAMAVASDAKPQG
jgi:predicted DNA-binding ribbon-helix-helix protein